MNLKAVDIAQILGISKATVSLALNNKAGVSPQTKKQILDLKAKIENNDPQALALLQQHNICVNHQISQVTPYFKNKIIKLIIFLKGYKVVVGDEIDLWSDVNTSYDKIAKEWGCSLEVMFFNVQTDSNEYLLQSCSDEAVIGVIACATELDKKDKHLLNLIQKPLVIYDADLGDDLANVQLDNFDCAYNATSFLADKGYTNILFVARQLEIYNYIQRRLGFLSFCHQHPALKSAHILKEGVTIKEITANLIQHFKQHGIPNAVLAESYHGTLATINACSILKIKIPEDLFIFGIDDIPSYMSGHLHIAIAKIPHILRVQWVMQILLLEINNKIPSKIKPKIFIPAQTVIHN